MFLCKCTAKYIPPWDVVHELEHYQQLPTTAKHARVKRIDSQIAPNTSKLPGDTLIQAKYHGKQTKQKRIIVHHNHESRLSSLKSGLTRGMKETLHSYGHQRDMIDYRYTEQSQFGNRSECLSEKTST